MEEDVLIQKDKASGSQWTKRFSPGVGRGSGIRMCVWVLGGSRARVDGGSRFDGYALELGRVWLVEGVGPQGYGRSGMKVRGSSAMRPPGLSCLWGQGRWVVVQG